MKSLIEKAFFLKTLHLFNELDLELLLAVAEKLHEEDYDVNEKVFASGQVANRIYFVVNGTIQVFDDKNRLVAELSEGAFFGDEALFNEQPRSYTAVCKTEALLLTLSRSHLLSVISECPSVAIGLLQSYAQKLPCRFTECCPLP